MVAPSKGEMKQTGEQMPGLQAQELDLKGLGEYGARIRALRYNALDTSKNRGPLSQRKSAIGEIKHSLLGPGDHDVVYVATSGDEVVGFLAVEKTPSGRIAKIRQLWTAQPERAQRIVVGKLLAAARNYLVEHGYPKLRAAPQAASSDFSVVSANPAVGRFLRLEEADAEPVDIELEDDMPAEARSAPDDDSEPSSSLEKAA